MAFKKKKTMLNNDLDIKTRSCYWFESCSWFFNFVKSAKLPVDTNWLLERDRQNKNTALKDE